MIYQPVKNYCARRSLFVRYLLMRVKIRLKMLIYPM